MRSILVVAAFGRGKGSGHLRRSFSLVVALRERGHDAFLSPEPADAAVPDSIDRSLVFAADPASRAWDLIVLDRFRTPPREYDRWAARAPVVGIDEGGRARAAFDYLLDLLPGPPGRIAPNRIDTGLLAGPARCRDTFPSELRRVLVTFGGEDRAGLTVPVAAALADMAGLAIDVIRPVLAPSAAFDRLPGGVRLLDPISDLKEALADYDLVVTHFGLTAYEAARARVSVLLVAPSRYHQTLARRAGFMSAGHTRGGRRAAARLRTILADPAELARRTAAAALRSESSGSHGTLADVIDSLAFPEGVACPFCGTRPGRRSPVIARFPDRSYRRCTDCGILFMTRGDRPPIRYDRDYFFDDYRKQYGRTYLEDFPHLEGVGRERVRRLIAVADGTHRRGANRTEAREGIALKSVALKGARLLDIGCAYGPFLAAARSEGLQPYGLDPAADAVRFVGEELGIPAAHGSFPDLDPTAVFGTEFDVVTLWYVIEHFPRLGETLEAVSRLLRPGGVFAFSTPSGSGVSARFRRSAFFERSPADHFTIWEPTRTAALLRRHGLRLEKIFVTGHHPERFPGCSGVEPGSPSARRLGAISRIFRLGDTFEAYAVKE